MSAHLRNRLSDLTDRLIDACDAPHRHARTAADLCAFFGDLTGFYPPDRPPVDADGTVLNTGLALSPKSAGLCLLDATRTVRFITGVYRTVRRLARKHPTVHVLYAGTGPFAPLAIPILAALPQGQVQFTLLDLHPTAIDCVRRLVAKLGLSEGIRACHVADAAQYRHPPGDPVHLIVVETMQNALNREPQVAITRNLSTQFSQRVPFIPRRVSIRAALAPRRPEVARKTVPMGPVFELSPDTVRCAPSTARIPAGIVRVPPTYRPEQRPLLMTRIQVSPSIAIDESECDLTAPAPFPEGPPLRPGNRLAFYYEISSYPQFKYRML